MTIDEGVNDEGVRRRSDRRDRTAARAAAGRGGPRGPRHDAQRVEAAAAARPRRGARHRGRARCRPGRRGCRTGAAGRDRPPADVHRADGPEALRPRVRDDQPAAHGGHGPPALRRPGRRGGAVRRAELLRGLRAHRRPGQDRGGLVRAPPGQGDARDGRRDPARRGLGARRDLDRGDRAALRRAPTTSRHQTRLAALGLRKAGECCAPGSTHHGGRPKRAVCRAGIVSCSRWCCRSPRRRSRTQPGASSCRRSCRSARQQPCPGTSPAARPSSAHRSPRGPRQRRRRT